MKRVFVFMTCLLLVITFSCKKKSDENDKNNKAVYTRRIVNLNNLGKDLIVSIDQKVFGAVMSGKIKAFEVDTLTPRSLLTVATIKERIDRKESTTVYPNPNAPEYGVDTMITKPFKTEDIVGHSIGEKFMINAEKGTFNGEIHSFGLNWKPVIANVELQEQAFMWISFTDLEKLLTPAEMKSLKKTLFEAMAKRLSDY